MKTPAIKSLQDLKAVKTEIETRARLAQEHAAARAAAAAKAKAEKELFSRTIGPVKSLPAKHLPGQRAVLPVAQAAPIAV
ncbi:MAG: DNA mismatch repair protein MutS, partial [Pseudomonadota bacterium]